MDGKRVEEIDIIKGASMLLVVVIHLVYRPKQGAADCVLMSLGWLIISLYYMLAGYNFTAGKRTVVQNYYNRIKNLLFPAIVAELVLLAVGGAYCAFVHGYSAVDWVHDIAVTFLRPEFCVTISPEWGNGGVLFDALSPSWFIWTMVWTELFFFPLAQISIGKQRSRWWIITATLFALQILLYIFVPPVSSEIQLLPLFTIFMLIGAKLREMKFAELEWKFNSAVTALISVVGFGALTGLFMLGGDMNYYEGNIGTHGNALDVILTVVQLPVGGIAFFALSKLIIKVRPISYALRWVGRHSFIFLICHCFFGMIAADILHTFIKPGVTWYVEDAGLTLTPEIFLKSLAGAVFSVICCILVSFAADKARERFRSLKK